MLRYQFGKIPWRRCSPEQKAAVVRLIERHSGRRAAAIGDGGNDVSMIQVGGTYYRHIKVLTETLLQAASVGIGIVGKEGKQASLAADFSITQVINKTRPQHKKGFLTNSDALPQFSHIGRLLLVHGRNSYKRSASLSQFVIHRGLIITTMQVCNKKYSQVI